jgi:hypothetical protein
MNSPITIISTLVAMCGLLAVARRFGRKGRGQPADLATAHTPDDLAYFHWMS